MQQKRVDWVTVVTAGAIVLGVCLPLALFQERGGRALRALHDHIAQQFGVVYLIAAVACLGFLIWLAASRHGRVILGDARQSPEFSTFSWMAMLFCAGVGAGLLYWCATEWAHYYLAPPFGAAPRSAQAAEWASTYGLFHWGFSAWAFYCLPTIAIAYPYYTRNLGALRFSTGFHPFLAGREQGGVARAIDFLFMLALLGGAGTSLGFSTPMIAAGFARLFGLEHDMTLNAFTLLLCVALFAVSIWLGLTRGIKRLSNANLALAFALLAFVLFAGPTLFLVKASVNSLGILAQNFVRMNFWTDPFGDSGFVEDWTVFYWAWWIAYAPFVGLFVARISRGRSIRQVILGMLLLGSLGSWLFYLILGNFSLYLELSGAVGIAALVEQGNGNGAIIAMFDQLPLPELVIGVFCLVSLVFSATTYDSASYTLASGATLGLTAGDNPARWHRMLWAATLGLLPLALMLVGGLKVIQTAVLVVSLPILLVGALMPIALLKSLRQR